jgi:serine protease Do
MSINNNIWDTAESYLAGTLPESEITKLNSRLASDKDFAAEFQESINLIQSLEGSGKQERFRTMLKEVSETSIKKSRRIQLPAHFWRTAAVAASVAVLTSTLTYSFLKPSIKNTDNQYNTIRREVDVIRETQKQLNQSQKQLEKDLKKINPPPSARVRYTGTGFAITNDGYFVTSNHVIDGADSIYIQDKNGGYFKATKMASDEESDIAVLKIVKKNFHFGKGDVPYTFAAGKSNLGASIFTLGYPKNDLVYKAGSISSKNGFDGNDLQYTLELPVSHGQSGSPVLDEKGNVIGILTAVGGDAEASTYAVSSKALITLLHKKMDTPIRLSKNNKLRKLSREQQIEKMEAYTFSVKVYKK